MNYHLFFTLGFLRIKNNLGVNGGTGLSLKKNERSVEKQKEW